MGLVGAHVRSLAGSRTAVFLAKTGTLRPLILKERAGSSNLNPQHARVLSAGSKAPDTSIVPHIVYTVSADDLSD
jgi:hypothetical protein